MVHLQTQRVHPLPVDLDAVYAKHPPTDDHHVHQHGPGGAAHVQQYFRVLNHQLTAYFLPFLTTDLELIERLHQRLHPGLVRQGWTEHNSQLDYSGVQSSHDRGAACPLPQVPQVKFGQVAEGAETHEQ